MKKILVSFIQDRSGSMGTVWEETLNGFKKYVDDLKADQAKDSEVEYLLTLTTFDTIIDTPHLGTKITDVDGDILKKYGPRGATALYDAVGKTIQAIDDNKTLTFDKAIVVIVTDGEENSSKEYSKEALHAAIDERIKRGNWTFTYLGTQPETWDEASSLGVGVGASATYNAQNAPAVYAVMAAATTGQSRSVHANSTSFLHANTTPVMRASVGIKTATDDDTVPVSTTGSQSWISHPVGPVSVKTTAPKKPGKNRRWK